MKKIKTVVMGVCALMLLACSSLPNQHPSVEAALKSLRKIDAATQVGVTKFGYHQLVIETKADVNEATRNLPDGELKTELSSAMKAYEDTYSDGSGSPGFDTAKKHLENATRLAEGKRKSK